jgi:hypothetical protein
MVCNFISLTSLAYCILPAEAKKNQLLFFSLEFDLVSISITGIDLSSKIDSSYKLCNYCLYMYLSFSLHICVC